MDDLFNIGNGGKSTTSNRNKEANGQIGSSSKKIINFVHTFSSVLPFVSSSYRWTHYLAAEIRLVDKRRGLKLIRRVNRFARVRNIYI